MCEKKFEFKVGDIVRLYHSNKEHEVRDNFSERCYPLRINGIHTFTIDGRASLDHNYPTLILIKRPKKDMTFKRIIDEGIKELKGSDGLTRVVLCFTKIDGLLVTHLKDKENAVGPWTEGEIKDWEAV
jgi:hypothetical protein